MGKSNAVSVVWTFVTVRGIGMALSWGGLPLEQHNRYIPTIPTSATGNAGRRRRYVLAVEERVRNEQMLLKCWIPFNMPNT